MRILTTFLCLLFLHFAAAAQSDQLEVGKRSSKSTVTAGIPGTKKDAGRWRFFRTVPEEKWRKIGYLGKNLRPVMKADSAAYEGFRQYRRTRIAVNIYFTGAMLSEYSAIACGLGWIASGLRKYQAGGNVNDNNAESQRWGVGTIGFLITGFVLIHAGNESRRKADWHLQNMVTQYNSPALSTVPDFKNERDVCLRPVLGNRIGFSLTF